ncbi:MAG: hypothetical protein NTY30_01540 [Candidatus Berkelbacteria bacterium]|nr:hypothetical protein [Candidatus Berkelbacteria bacterium]
MAIDMDFVRKMAKQASKACVADFDEIERGLPICLTAQGGRRPSPRRRKRLLEMCDQIKERTHLAGI